MIAVDTNILVRILTNDDPIQARRAVKILKSDDIFYLQIGAVGDGTGTAASL